MANHLKNRKPSKRAKEEAIELKKIYLNSLANELQLPLINDEIESLIKSTDIKSHLSLLTYLLQ